jgi:hypothetical protein
MRRVLRIIFNTLAAVCVLLAVWFYFAWAFDLDYQHHARLLISHQRIDLMWHDGGLLFELTGPWPEGRLDDSTLLTRRLPWLEYFQPPKQWNHAGILLMHGQAEFAYEAYRITANSKPRHLHSLVIEISTRDLVVLVCVTPLAWLIRRLMHKRHKSRREGLCPACGYDMRATPTRCPECGKEYVKGRACS